MRLVILMLLTSYLYACQSANQQKEPFASLLSRCDSVDIVFYHGGDRLHFHPNDSISLKRFCEAVTGTTASITDTCQPVGELHYASNQQPILSAQFAVRKDANGSSCNYLSYTYEGKAYKHPLTDKIKQVLQQMYVQIQ